MTEFLIWALLWYAAGVATFVWLYYQEWKRGKDMPAGDFLLCVIWSTGGPLIPFTLGYLAFRTSGAWTRLCNFLNKPIIKGKK